MYARPFAIGSRPDSIQKNHTDLVFIALEFLAKAFDMGDL